MTCRLIAIDLDGTLLDSTGKVSARTANALRAAHDAGIVLAPATARFYQAAIRPFAALGIDVAAIASAGADVRAAGGAVVSQRALEPEFAAFVAELCDRASWTATLATPERAYRRENPPPAWAASAPEWLKPVTSLAAEQLASVLAVLAEASTGSEHWPELEAWADRANVFPALAYNGDALLTITAAGVDKGAGLRALCRHLGISPGEAVAIGDSEVDIPMFEAAGASFAMADGTEAARAAATRLTATADDDGVARVIEEVLG